MMKEQDYRQNIQDAVAEPTSGSPGRDLHSLTSDEDDHSDNLMMRNDST